MTRLAFIFILIFSCRFCFAQVEISNWSSSSQENIVVEKLAGDSLTTSFMIQVRNNVSLHYHAYHSEHIYVLSGSGEFISEKDTSMVSEGSYIFIPSKSKHAVRVISSEPLRVLSIQSPRFLGIDRIKVL